MEEKLREIAPLVDRVEKYAGEYGRAADELLPEAGRIETGKGYRENKAIPFVQKLQDKLFSLYVAYCKLKSKYERLERDYDDISNRKERLQIRNEALEQEVEELKVVTQDYSLIRTAFGTDKVDNMVKNLKERERLKIETGKRKLQRNHYHEER